MPFLTDYELEFDPDGKKEKVAVVMKGTVYKEAGLIGSDYPDIESALYEKLSSQTQSLSRDGIRKLALEISVKFQNKDFQPSILWLDNFIRRFCLSREKIPKLPMIKVKGSFAKKAAVAASSKELDSSKPVVDVEKTLNDLGLNSASNGNTNNGTSTAMEKNQTAPKESTSKDSNLKIDIKDEKKQTNGKNKSTVAEEDSSENSSCDERSTGSTKNCKKKLRKREASEDVILVSSDEEKSSSQKASDSDSDSTSSDIIENLLESNLNVQYTKKENKYYTNNMSSLMKGLETTKTLTCTACYENVNPQIESQVFTHTSLGVLLCKKCFLFYGKGNFKKDEDGCDEYCRWCANGGDLLLCDSCTNGFCKKCIKRNMGRTAVNDISKAKNWNCYICDLTPLTEIRAKHRALKERLKPSIVENTNSFNPKKNLKTRSGSTNENEEGGSKKVKKSKKDNSKKKTPSSKKSEGLLDISLDNQEDNVDEDEEELDEEESLVKELPDEDKAKNALLESSDEEKETQSNIDSSTEHEEDEEALKKKEEEDRKKFEKKKLKNKVKSDDEDYAPKNSTDDEETVKQKKRKMKFSLRFSSSEDEEDEDSGEEKSRKQRMFVDSDDSDDGKKKKKQKKLLGSTDEEQSSEEEEEEEKPKKKARRKRIRREASSSDDGGKKEEKDSPSKKKIRKIIKDEDLLTSTKNATQEEEDRNKRIQEKQKMYNKFFEIDVEKDEKDRQKSVILDFNSETKKEIVSVNEKLVSSLKPHQVKGIRFMWDASIESLNRLEKGDKGGGCILAHCMGLGKTLQVVAFVHTLLTNKHTSRKVSRVMVVCPMNTIYNWVQEFSKWLKGKMMSFDVVELISSKDYTSRVFKLDEWYNEGGVCIMGYDMFRSLKNINKKKVGAYKKETLTKCLIKPGPDLIICDEGHCLKNEKTALAKALTEIQTKRRIVLTGTPLQNNLKEYHCMIQFVKPNLLGNQKEFANRFVNPITAGQTNDAGQREVKRMKRRAHILHDLLKGCVQRFDYSVLQPFLPKKHEYVVYVQLSDLQAKLYQYYLDHLVQGGPNKQSLSGNQGLFQDFSHLGKVWSHPAVLYLAEMKRNEENDFDELEAEDEEFIDDSTTEESSDDDYPKKKKKKKEEEKNPQVEEEVPEAERSFGLTSTGKVKPNWWRKVVGEMGDEDDLLNRADVSGKIYLLLLILRQCTMIGDKLLVFSQWIPVLTMIENFLHMVNSGEMELPKLNEEDNDPLPFKQWKLDQDYLRLDGSTNADIRKNQCRQFNHPNNERCRLFLISTRAGGVGINLVGANRVVMFDTSWNPSHDTQSVFRIYRFGQLKPCYVYRLVAQGTMEAKIYSRQVTKISTSLRVVDEQQIKRHYNKVELSELYEFKPADVDKRETPNVPEDRLLREMLINCKKWIVSYHEQDTMLENQTEEQLTEAERKAAWEEFENDKKGIIENTGLTNFNKQISARFDVNAIAKRVVASNPNISEQLFPTQLMMACYQERDAYLNNMKLMQGLYANLINPNMPPEIKAKLPFANNPSVVQQQMKIAYDNVAAANAYVQKIQMSLGSKPTADSLKSAGLIRGQPAMTGAVNDYAKFINMNVPRPVTIMPKPPTILPKPPTVPAANQSGPSTSTSTNTDSTSKEIKKEDKKNEEKKDAAEVVTLE